MIKKQINQNDTLKLEFIKTLKNEFEFSKSPINRVKKIDSIAEEKFEDKKILSENGIVILHRHKNESDSFPVNLKVIEKKTYGISKIIFLSKSN